mmetsp:Transcript_104177/g.325558  ORF Transcript_104177/g.325558 Transcript_104177/m.325558 type:complete len:266 (-) Transcript_104177:171-968(-)
MRRLGVNAWPLNTVQFSNHTQYGKWTGHVFDPQHLSEIVDGIANVGGLSDCDAVLSGYLGSAKQGDAVLEVVRQVKEANPKAIYCCDPVMGHPEKGCIVAPGVAEFLTQEAVSVADIMCPNTLELGILTSWGAPMTSIDDVRAAADKLLRAGPRVVFVKHLGLAGYDSGHSFEMLLATMDGTWHAAAPLLHFDRPPVGVGDFTSGVLLAKYLRGASMAEALEHTTAAYHAVMTATLQLRAYELQIVAAQERIAHPDVRFTATRLS